MSYYAVKAKCGHVGGRTKYIPITFHVIAENKADAAAIIRSLPRVKHDQKNAIISVEQINEEEYRLLVIDNANDPYLNCKNPQEQEKILPLIKERILDDDFVDFDDIKKELKKKKTKMSETNKKKFSKYVGPIEDDMIEEEINEYSKKLVKTNKSIY
jgi:hypothetical protein